MGYLGQIALTRRTWADGAWLGGTFTRGAPTDSTIYGAFRPMGAASVQLLEQGDRVRDPRVLVTDTECQVVEQGTGLVSDHVSPDGGSTWWEIIGVRDGSTATAFTAGPGVNGYSYNLLRVQEADG